MADRTILKYTENRLPEGPFWTLNVERSASGKPDVFLTVEFESFDGTLESRATTILVEDADRVLAPVIKWAADRRAANAFEAPEDAH